MPQDSNKEDRAQVGPNQPTDLRLKETSGSFFVLKEDIDIPKYYEWLKKAPEDDTDPEDKNKLPFWRSCDCDKETKEIEK